LVKEALWRERVASQRESGLSIRAFCRGEGLGEAAFHWWRRELALRDREVDSVEQGDGGRSAVVPEAGRKAFVEVSMPRDGDWPVAAPVEVVLRGGRVLRVGAGFSTETVSRLLALLERDSC